MAFTKRTTSFCPAEPEPDGERSPVLGLRWQSVALAVLAVLALVALRAPFLDGDLLKCDEAVYGVTARAWTQGLLPGRDVWDNKPPGMAALYLLASHLPGGTILGSRLLALLFSAVTLLVTLRLARLIAPKLPVWPVAMAYLLITHANGWFPAEWVTLNGELPSTCLVALGVWCLAEWARGKEPRLWPLLVLAGVFSGASILFRQTALLPVLAMAGWLVWFGLRTASYRGAFQAIGLAVAG
ncbi:MAG: ArnT family glycosyltransferase, partial [Bacteroidota bacterium]